MALRLATVFLFCVMTSGCVTQEGVGFGGNSLFSTADFDRDSVADGSEANPEPVTSVVVIGNVSALRRLAGEGHEKVYEWYLEASDGTDGDEDPKLSLEAFRDVFAGWSRIETADYFLVRSYATTLVPSSAIGLVDFANSIEVVTFGIMSDLVVAKTNEDGVLVLSDRLCDWGQGYSRCAKRHKRGLFDAATGRQIDRDGRIKPNGATIDLTTYWIIE